MSDKLIINTEIKNEDLGKNILLHVSQNIKRVKYDRLISFVNHIVEVIKSDEKELEILNKRLDLNNKRLIAINENNFDVDEEGRINFNDESLRVSK